jgi:hypothetical protein
LLEGIHVDELSESQRAVIKKSYGKLLDEVLALREAASNETDNREIRHAIFNTLKEISEMTRRRSSAIFSHLFEADGAMDEMEILIDDEDLEALGVEEPEEVDIDALDVSLDMAGGEEGGDEEEEGGEEEAEDEELELEEMAMEADHDEMMGEADHDEVYEIDESALRREIARMRNIREQAESEAVEAAEDFGGGAAEEEIFVDVDEDDLLNALADELGDVPAPTVESVRRRRARRVAARRRAAAVQENKKVRKALQENAALKRQLSEMNLFNAKLLYVNKLMQNRNVTHEQKRAIVEALDNAKTIREAKLVYQGLSHSLKKKSTLKESAARRVLGSASKSTRKSGSKLNESGVTDRWATLAGIKN